MPIRECRKHLYPPDWKDIRTRILNRDKSRCKWCGVPNYACGWRDEQGRFNPTCGNLIHDAAGQGELAYAEARELVDNANDWTDGLGFNGERGLVIVLTIAHLNHDETDCRDENLAALCQRCHNRHDTEHRRKNARKTRLAKIGQETFWD